MAAPPPATGEYFSRRFWYSCTKCGFEMNRVTTVYVLPGGERRILTEFDVFCWNRVNRDAGNSMPQCCSGDRDLIACGNLMNIDGITTVDMTIKPPYWDISPSELFFNYTVLGVVLPLAVAQ